MKRVWGLTGGVAAGKSTVASLLRSGGFSVLDADKIARGLTEPGGTAFEEVMRVFGTVDRSELRQIVFKDPAQRKRLEGILHPKIVMESAKQLVALALETPHLPVIYEASLLVETGRYKDFDGLILVDAPASLRRERLITRDQTAPLLADQMIAAQADDATRRAAASQIIHNQGSLEDLKVAVAELSEMLRRGAN